VSYFLSMGAGPRKGWTRRRAEFSRNRRLAAVRLVQLNSVDVELVIGMNRLRRGYLDLAPELERDFVATHREDIAGIMQTHAPRPAPAPDHGPPYA
jgi:hypothetical protein